MTKTKRRDMTGFTDTTAVPAAAIGGWPVVPGDASLIAWDGHREANTRKEARLFRLGNGRYLVVERYRDTSMCSSAEPKIVRRELSVEEACELFAHLRVKVITDVA